MLVEFGVGGGEALGVVLGVEGVREHVTYVILKVMGDFVIVINWRFIYF